MNKESLFKLNTIVTMAVGDLGTLSIMNQIQIIEDSLLRSIYTEERVLPNVIFCH